MEGSFVVRRIGEKLGIDGCFVGEFEGDTDGLYLGDIVFGIDVGLDVEEVDDKSICNVGLVDGESVDGGTDGDVVGK